MPIHNPLPELVDHLKIYQPELEKLKSNEEELDFSEQFKKYEELKKQFFDIRVHEYLTVRNEDVHVSFQAEAHPVWPGQARITDRNSKTYNAPQNMKLDIIHINAQAEIGNTYKESIPSIESKQVTVNIRARSRYRPDGRSHIIVQPTTIWKHGTTSAERLSEGEWDKIKHGVLS